MTLRLLALFSPFRSLRGALALGFLVPLMLVTAASADYEEMRALAHSRLSTQLLLNQGLTLLYGPARRDLEAPGTEGLRAFGGLTGGRQEVSGDGRTEVDGFSFLAGLGRRMLIDDPSVLAAFSYGLFGEGGTGSFETSHDFGTGTLRSEGRSRYVGGGILLKAEFHNRFYMDGTFRAGQAKTSLDTPGWWSNLLPAPPSLDSSGIYLSAAGSVGRRVSLGDQLDLDVYGRLLWSRQEAGESQTFGVQPVKVKVADINSTRTMFGTRADYQVGEGRLIYAGAAWEHEFNGRAELTVDSHPYRGPFADLSGSSLAGEVGLQLAGGDGFSASFGLEGALGRREAIGGVLRLGYEF